MPYGSNAIRVLGGMAKINKGKAQPKPPANTQPKPPVNTQPKPPANVGSDSAPAVGSSPMQNQAMTPKPSTPVYTGSKKNPYKPGTAMYARWEATGGKM